MIIGSATNMSLPQPIIVEAPVELPATTIINSSSRFPTGCFSPRGDTEYDDYDIPPTSPVSTSSLQNDEHHQGVQRKSTNTWGWGLMQSPLNHSWSLMSNDTHMECTTLSFISGVAGSGRSDNTTSNSRVDLFGDQAPMGLPSPMMKFRCASGPADHPLTRAYEERLLLARRRERTPPPAVREAPSASLNSVSDEIVGDIVVPDPEPVRWLNGGCRYRFPMSDEDYTDGEQNSFVATTTGASCGKLTNYSVATSPKSDVNGLFSRQRSYQPYGGLFSFSGDCSRELSSSAV